VCGRVVPEAVAAVRVAVTPVAMAFAVPPDKSVVTAPVALRIDVAMGFAVVQGHVVQIRTVGIRAAGFV